MGDRWGQEFESFSTKAVFLVRVAKHKLHHFSPRRKTFGKIHLWTPAKNPSDAHAHKHAKLYFWKKIVLYYTIWQHCSTTPLRKAGHSTVTDCARCILPHNYESCQIRQIHLQIIDKILLKFRNISFIELFNLTMDPLLIVLKVGGPASLEIKVGGQAHAASPVPPPMTV